MSPLRRHGGGRPRSPHSILEIVERWGISEKAARRLAALKLGEDEMALLVRDSQRYAAAQRREVEPHGRYTGGMRALGMRSRIPASCIAGCAAQGRGRPCGYGGTGAHEGR